MSIFSDFMCVVINKGGDICHLMFTNVPAEDIRNPVYSPKINLPVMNILHSIEAY